MLFPKENCNAVPEVTPRDLRLVPVTTLEEALEVLLQPNAKLYPKC
jgi:predicted ATP-dependent protease